MFQIQSRNQDLRWQKFQLEVTHSKEENDYWETVNIVDKNANLFSNKLGLDPCFAIYQIQNSRLLQVILYF